jgi:hypothetical protein
MWRLPKRKPKRDQANWPWIVGTGSVGGVLLAGAFLLQHFWRWQGVTLNVLVNVGTAVFLAGGLFLVQRRFIVRVETAANAAITQAFEEESRELNVRIDELQTRMGERLQEQQDKQTSIVSDLETPTYFTVARALAEVYRVGGLPYGSSGLSVQGTTTPGEVRLTFSWVTPNPALTDSESNTQLLLVTLEFRTSKFNTYGPEIEYVWAEDETSVDFGGRLQSGLQQADVQLFKRFDWSVSLRNLQIAVDYSLRSRRLGEDVNVIRGRVIELVQPGWLMTTSGLESPERSYLFPGESFPERLSTVWRVWEAVKSAPWEPAAPDWLPETEWKRIIALAKWRYPLDTGPFKRAPRFKPLSEGPKLGS